jgi:farnesyl diphosphate synthase
MNLLYSTVPGGKMNRGLTVASSLSSIFNRELTDSEKKHARILGWCIELLQACFLIADDIMDGSYTRRGKLCRYRQPGVGMTAINDAFILESAIYKLLKTYFRTHDSYIDFLELMHETSYQTELGQLMDLITAPEGVVDLSKFSHEKFVCLI